MSIAATNWEPMVTSKSGLTWRNSAMPFGALQNFGWERILPLALHSSKKGRANPRHQLAFLARCLQIHQAEKRKRNSADGEATSEWKNAPSSAAGGQSTRCRPLDSQVVRGRISVHRSGFSQFSRIQRTPAKAVLRPD